MSNKWEVVCGEFSLENRLFLDKTILVSVADAGKGQWGRSPLLAIYDRAHFGFLTDSNSLEAINFLKSSKTATNETIFLFLFHLMGINFEFWTNCSLLRGNKLL